MKESKMKQEVEESSCEQREQENLGQRQGPKDNGERRWLVE